MSPLQNQRVLITGGAGFLGREVTRAVKSRKPAAVLIPRKATHDLCEQEVVRRLMQSYRPDVVLHLAAEVGGIGANQRNPGRFFYANAVMGIHLMEEARLAGVKKYVQVGTVCSYPKFTPVPFSEDDLWNGYPEETNAPYGLAKKMLLVQAQAYRQQYGLNAVTLIPVNLYGPGDNFDRESSHVIPALIRKAIEAREAGHKVLNVWGTGAASREFLFVRDAARGIVQATENYDRPEPVNLGAGQEVKIRDLVGLICQLCDFSGEVRWESDKPDGQPRRCVDASRARQAFQFQATTNLREGLLETVAWYERKQNRLQARRLSAAQEPRVMA